LQVYFSSISSISHDYGLSQLKMKGLLHRLTETDEARKIKKNLKEKVGFVQIS
jgi:hypothetical protein